MLQLLEKVRQRFHTNRPRPSYPIPAPPAVDWAAVIWAYTQSLWRGGWSLKNSHRAEKECGSFGRGLAFGQVRILKGEQHGVTLTVTGDKKPTAALVREAVVQALREHRLEQRTRLEPGTFGDGLEVVLADDKDPLPAQSSCTIRNGGSFSYRSFLRVNCWSGDELREMEAPSLEALGVLVRACEILGFPAGPKHYANETPVRIEDIIVYAVRWEDPQTHCRYLDVLWRPELVVSGWTQGGGPSDERTEGAYEGEVTACTPGGDWWPKRVINNRPVYAAVSETPTPPMLKAKEKFARESVRVCSYCGKPATRQFMHVRFETTGDLGGSSMGGITYGCADEACAAKAHAQNAIRTSEMPFTQDVWA